MSRRIRTLNFNLLKLNKFEANQLCLELHQQQLQREIQGNACKDSKIESFKCNFARDFFLTLDAAPAEWGQRAALSQPRFAFRHHIRT